jgi:ATP-dependent DNA helicase RecG
VVEQATVRSEIEYLRSLISELRKLPAETPWVEFKESYANPEDVGEYLSALSNAAALAGKEHGYVVWGIHDRSHVVVGTAFSPNGAKKGGELLESGSCAYLAPASISIFTS